MEAGASPKKLTGGPGAEAEGRAYRAAMRKAKYAELMDHFGWHPEQIARLTDRQIDEYAFHARDRDTNAIKRPEPPGMTLEQHLASFAALAGVAGASRGQVEAGLARIREDHARRERGEPPLPAAPRQGPARGGGRRARHLAPRQPKPSGEE